MAQIEANAADDVPTLHRRAMRGFSARVAEVGDDQWALPTP